MDFDRVNVGRYPEFTSVRAAAVVTGSETRRLRVELRVVRHLSPKGGACGSLGPEDDCDTGKAGTGTDEAGVDGEDL